MKPYRYMLRQDPINLWQSIIWLFRQGEWTRTVNRFDPIHPDDPRYEQAWYEMGVIHECAPRSELDKHDHKPQ